MKIGSPKNLEGKNLLVGVSAVDSNGNAIGSDITTLKNGANVTFTSSANGVLVIAAESVASGGGSVTSASNATITLTQGGVVKGSFTLNQSTNSTIALDAGGGSVTVVDEITSTETNAVSGRAVYNYVSSQMGNVSSLLATL